MPTRLGKPWQATVLISAAITSALCGMLIVAAALIGPTSLVGYLAGIGTWMGG